MRPCWTLVLCLLSPIPGFQAYAAEAQVMILGTYHFANPNQDYVKSNFDDHLSEKRQAEIADVVARLARYQPTRIVVEAQPTDTIVNVRYTAYLAGTHTLSASEMQQLGFRLAKQLGHQKLYLCDHKLDMDIEGVVKAAQETGNTAFLTSFQSLIAEVQALQERATKQTVLANLIEGNEAKLIDWGRQSYLQMTRVRGKDSFIGADVVADWYRRNFRIAANIAQVIESPDDRVLVLFGHGHAAILRDALGSCPDLELVEPNDYLKNP